MRARTVLSILLFALLVSGLSIGAFATDTIYYAADATLIHQVLSSMELEYEVMLDNNDDPTWTFNHLGILITIISYDKVSYGHYGSLLFYTGWTTDAAISLALINEWNSTSRFGRAYIDDSGDPVIELDLLLTGGVTEGTIQEYITVFAQAASSLGVALGL